MGVMRGFTVKTGLAFEQANKTGYNESRYMHLVCPVCGTRFHRPPSHVARNKGHTTCSRGCASEARRVRIETHCVACGKSMEQTPSDAKRITTCCKECSTLRRIKDINNVRPWALGAYQKKMKEIANRGDCVNCGVEMGPWVVRGLRASVDDSGASIVDDSSAELWCRHCHLCGISESGLLGRVNKLGY